MAKPKVDWSRLCSEYVTASQPVTLTDLANAYGIARETVSRKATKEQWDVKRERYLMRVQEQTAELKSQTVAKAGADFDTSSLDFARKGLAIADRLLDDKSLDPRVVKDILAAGRTAQQIAKDAMGDKPADPPAANLNVTLSVEDVAKKYADAGSSPVSSENGSPQ